MIRLPGPLARTAAVSLFAAALLAPVHLCAQVTSGLQGAWAADRYLMAEAGEHDVQGRIFFTDREWQVLFFVVDESGEVRRGSAEGGTYSLVGDALVLTHLFNLSAGEAMP